MVSVGSDKAIVVWDWRTGNKLVRFGQQTNVCIGMNLLDNFIISATVDGVIRTFSIAKREMLGAFKLSELAKYQPEFADKLKDVGVGALGMLTWFKAEGRFMAVSCTLSNGTDRSAQQRTLSSALHGTGRTRRRRPRISTTLPLPTTRPSLPPSSPTLPRQQERPPVALSRLRSHPVAPQCLPSLARLVAPKPTIKALLPRWLAPRPQSLPSRGVPLSLRSSISPGLSVVPLRPVA